MIKRDDMEGAWEVKVTFRNCQTGAPIRSVRALNTFGGGGTVMEIGASDPPNLRAFGQGRWRHTGGPNYTAVMKFFRFNRDGSFAGTDRITRNIELSDDGKEFAATAFVEIFDIDDKLIQTGCATETATRS